MGRRFRALCSRYRHRRPGFNRILVCNSAFALLHKSRIEDVVGSSILSLYTPSERDHVRQNVTRADQIGHTQFELIMVRRDDFHFSGSDGCG